MKVGLLFLLPLIAFGYESRIQAIYGEENIRPLSSRAKGAIGELSRSIVRQVPISALKQLADGTYELNFETFSRIENVLLCPDDPWANRLATESASCTGFFVADNQILTAGHCAHYDFDCSENVWVKNVYSDLVHNKKMIISQDQIYQCEKILKSEKVEETGRDFAFVQTKELSKNFLTLSRRSQQPDRLKGQQLFMLGFPLGMPMQMTMMGYVQSFQGHYFFTDLDGFHGNSGSPVINPETFEVEGIYVNGSEDFIFHDGDTCQRINYCKNGECNGEIVMSSLSLEFP